MVEQAYMDYAPLFNALHGARWLLTARPGWADSAVVNVLTTRDGGYLVPVMLANRCALFLFFSLHLFLYMVAPVCACRRTHLCTCRCTCTGMPVSGALSLWWSAHMHACTCLHKLVHSNVQACECTCMVSVCIQHPFASGPHTPAPSVTSSAIDSYCRPHSTVPRRYHQCNAQWRS